jgi:hypothetical protein
MKKRLRSSVIGNAGINAVRAYCDKYGFQAEPREDFGVDAYIELELDTSPRNFLVGAQVKSGPSYRRSRSDGSFSIGVRQADAAYWLAANYPVVFMYLCSATGELYFKHVQAAFQDARSLSECRSLVFGPIDLAEPDRLARYIAQLARSTPTLPDRFRVLQSPAFFSIGPHRVAVVSTTCDSAPLLTFDRYRITAAAEAFQRYPLYPRVLGYSSNDRWACESRVHDDGGRGSLDAEIVFVDLQSNAELKVRLFTADELNDAFERTDALDLARLNETIDRLNHISQELLITPAASVYDGYHGYDVSPAPSPQDLAFVIGDEVFSVSVGLHKHRDALILRADRFEPPRVAPLLIERAPRATLLQPSVETPIEDMFPIGFPQRYEAVAGIGVSANGANVCIAVMTADSHPCWGTRTVHLAHFRTDDLRRACAEALRV